MAKLLNKEPAVYKQEQDNFLRELRKFHTQKGTIFRHIPSINGREVDLYLLYWLVTAQGGWERVNSNNGWEDLLESFELETGTTNGSLALKQTYLRFLDAYEKYNYLGEREEEDGNMFYDEEDSRARRQRQQKIVTSVPSVYNEAQHRVTENIRVHYGMSTELYEPTDYDRLTLSLLSPLPNEQDFAINVATLLSNEGRHTLKLAKCPRLLDLLLSHAGVFNHHTHRKYMDENYRETRNYDQVRFWRDVCRNSAVLELIYDEKNFYPKISEPESNFFAEEFSTEYDAATASDRLDQLKRRAAHEVTDSDAELFAVGRSMGTREPTGQRVLQIATILRNISFEEDNVAVLAKNLTLLRFVLLCVNSSWSNLNQTGFDILSNIAGEIQLEEPSEDAVTDLMIKSLTRCIGDQDRFQVISALDVLNKFASLTANEELLQRLLEASVYRQLVDYLSLHDIHLLIATLECLYSLSSLGEQPCNSIVKTHSAIELLVSLVTVEAQSYGPKACILMRVVETVPQPGPNQQPSSAPQPPQQAAPPPMTTSSGSPARPMQPTAPGQSTPANPILPTKPLPPAAAAAAAAQQQQQQPRLAAPPHAPHGVGGVASQPPPGSQQVQLKVSNDEPHRVFCLSWLKATYETAPGKSIEQNIMYKQYLASMHRMGRREVISAQHYALCIRTLFGGSTGPNKKQVADKLENHYTGIQVRAQPLPLKLTPAQAAAAHEASRQQGGGITIQQQAGQQVLLQQTQQQPAVQQQPPQQQVVQTGHQVVRPTPPVAAAAVGQPPQKILQQGGPGQVMTIVNQQGQPVSKLVNSQGQLVNSQGQLVNSQGQLVNSQGQLVNTQGQLVNSQSHQQQTVFQGQLVNSQGQIVTTGPQRQVLAATGQGQVLPGGGLVVQGQQAGSVQVVQGNVIQAGQPGATAGQIVQNVVNAQGQIIQKRIISQQPGGLQTVIQQPPGQQQQLIQGQVVMSAGGQQQIVVASGGGNTAAVGQPGQQQHVVVQGQPGQVLVQAGGQSGQIVQTAAPGQQSISGGGAGQVVIQGQVVKSTPSSGGQTVIRTQQEEILENGISPLDGILPKDPSFGKMDELLDKKEINGIKEKVVISNHVDYTKLNGDSGGGSGKRGPDETMENLPAKKPALEGVVTNGLTNGGVITNGGGSSNITNSVKVLPNGQVVQVAPPSSSGGVGGGQQVLVGSGGQPVLVTSSGGGQTLMMTGASQAQAPQIIQTSTGFYLKTTTNGGPVSAGGGGQPPTVGGVLVQSQGGGSGGGVMLQPQQQAVLVQQPGGGQQMLLIQSDQKPPTPSAVVAAPQQQQQIVQQVIQTSNGQQIVRQVVVNPSNATNHHHQPQQQQHQQQLPVATTNTPGVLVTNRPAAGQQQQQLVTANHHPHLQQQHHLQAGTMQSQPMTNGTAGGGGSPSPPVAVSPAPPPAPCPSPPPVKIDPGRPFLCEWCNCMKSFKTPKEVERHAIAEHCPLDGDVDLPCLWARCDGMKRKRFSLMTHLQDRHCHPQLMKLMAVRRVQIMQQGKSDVPLPPAPPPHPGYAPNAALAAIKRHAQEFISPKENEMRDEKEGPVTKSIRLTASLILRNLVIYSPIGRTRLRAYESHLSTVALSSVESNTTVAKMLYDMSNAKDYQ